jgi:hypothetical protein
LEFFDSTIRIEIGVSNCNKTRVPTPHMRIKGSRRNCEFTVPIPFKHFFAASKNAPSSNKEQGFDFAYNIFTITV